MAANGYLPLSSLTKVDGWAYLETNTAHAWVAVCDELVALGYPRPTITAPDGAYRTYAQQVYWKTYWTARGLPGNASTPGFSNHGLGTCVDVWDVYKWPRDVLTRVMNKHGFVNDVASEPWHWHRTSINPADSGAATRITPILEEDDMPIVIKADPTKPSFGYIFAGWNYVQEPSGIIRPVGSDAEMNLLVALGAKVVTWKAQDIYTLLASKFGFRGFEGDATRGVVKLTGQIIYTA